MSVWETTWTVMWRVSVFLTSGSVMETLIAQMVKMNKTAIVRFLTASITLYFVIEILEQKMCDVIDCKRSRKCWMSQIANVYFCHILIHISYTYVIYVYMFINNNGYIFICWSQKGLWRFSNMPQVWMAGLVYNLRGGLRGSVTPATEQKYFRTQSTFIYQYGSPGTIPRYVDPPPQKKKLFQGGCN